MDETQILRVEGETETLGASTMQFSIRIPLRVVDGRIVVVRKALDSGGLPVRASLHAESTEGQGVGL